MTRADRRIMWQVVWSILAVGWAAASIVAIWRLPLVDGLTLGCLCGALLLPCGWAEWVGTMGDTESGE
jgi:hypothetical protein